jgi:hypothetical protein
MAVPAPVYRVRLLPEDQSCVLNPDTPVRFRYECRDPNREFPGGRDDRVRHPLPVPCVFSSPAPSFLAPLLRLCELIRRRLLRSRGGAFRVSPEERTARSYRWPHGHRLRSTLSPAARSLGRPGEFRERRAHLRQRASSEGRRDLEPGASLATLTWGGGYGPRYQRSFPHCALRRGCELPAEQSVL